MEETGGWSLRGLSENRNNTHTNGLSILNHEPTLKEEKQVTEHDIRIFS